MHLYTVPLRLALLRLWPLFIDIASGILSTGILTRLLTRLCGAFLIEDEIVPRPLAVYLSLALVFHVTQVAVDAVA